MMRIAIGQFNALSDEKLRFAQQIGVTGVQMNTPKLPGETHWEVDDLRALVEKCESFDLTLEAIENVPIHFYDKAMLGLPGGAEQIGHYQTTVRNLAAAGIPILGIHWMPNSVWRTTVKGTGRGGAHVTAFDMAVIDSAGGAKSFVAKTDERMAALVVEDDPILTHDQMWENFATFMHAVLPVAEEVDVKIALHPDDPPVPMLGGVPRIFGSVEGFEKAVEIADSSAFGFDLCLGCCSEMPGGRINVMRMIERFGSSGKIFYIHFRDVQGTVPAFKECFIGEGNYDPAEVMLALRKVGFDGFLLDDHVPHMDDDSDWQHRGRAHAIGYMQGLMNMMEHVTS
ncbi:MAG: mannonate dehydratase [Thermomicrobiales bacterium]